MSDNLYRDPLAVCGKSVRTSARSILGENGNRLKLVMAGIFCVTISFLTYFPANTVLYYYVRDPYIGLLLGDALMFFSFLLLAMPVWLGMYRMAVRMVSGADPDLSELFYYCGTRRLYGRALGITFTLLPCWIPLLGGLLMAQLFFYFDGVGFLIALFVAVTVLLGTALSTRHAGFVTLAVAREDMPLSGARAYAAMCTEGRRMCFLRWDLGIILRLFLSIIPVGLVFLLNTLPMSMLSCAVSSLRHTQSRNDFDHFPEKE